MTAEPDLLPLPRVLVHVPHEGDMEMEAVGNYYEASKVREFLAAKDAEIEALRAERDAYKAADESMQQAHYEACVRARAAEARAERLAEALRPHIDDLIASADVARAAGLSNLAGEFAKAASELRAALEQEAGR